MRNFLIIVVIIIAIIGSFSLYRNKVLAPETAPDAKNMQTLKITSSVFEENKIIPPKYTCDGENINPPLEISGIPENSKSLVLIMNDPDAPMGVWDHWIKWNIPVTGESMVFGEGEEPAGISGKNSGGKFSYQGPCPPNGEHRYFFKIYALNSTLNLPEGSGRKETEKAMGAYIIASGELMGRYNRTK